MYILTTIIEALHDEVLLQLYAAATVAIATLPAGV